MEQGTHISLDICILLIYILDITNGAQSIGGGGSVSSNSNNNNNNDLDVGPYKIPTSKTFNKTIIMSSNSDSSNVIGTTITITTQDPFNPDVRRQFSRDEPYFDASTPKNVTALVGKSAYLNCRVRNLGNKTVAFVRHRDLHILTVGSYTYTTDQRFIATHHKKTDEWTLQIKWTQKRDAGVYECQISTQPARSYFIYLSVVVPTASILGGPDIYVDKGSMINLTCTVKYSSEPPAYIFWYHHEEVVSYDSLRGGISVITEKAEVTTSYLLIQNADTNDSGKYICAPSNADVANVRVHVLNGEQLDYQKINSGVVRWSSCTSIYIILFILLNIASIFNYLVEFRHHPHQSINNILHGKINTNR